MNLSPEHGEAIRALVHPEILLNRIRTNVHRLTITTYPALPGTDARARRITREPLLTQLREAIRPSLGRTASGAGDGNRIPLSASALELLETTEAEIASAFETATDRPANGTGEQLLAEWFEQFARAYEAHQLNNTMLERYATLTRKWAMTIEDYFDPPRTREYPLCPACGYTHMLRPDDAGEPIQVRCLILRHRPTGHAVATCRHCAAEWEGIILPAGVGGDIRYLPEALEAIRIENGTIDFRLAPPRDTDPDDDTGDADADAHADADADATITPQQPLTTPPPTPTALAASVDAP